MNEIRTSKMKDVCAIVPALNPDQKFLTVIRLLIERGFSTILIVDDGSRAECNIFFEEAMSHPQCVLIRHYKNLGKGRALKTAFNYYLTHFPGLKGAVTVDADNQHHIDDIVNCAECLLDHPDALVLGVRDFNSANVPKR
ncbi:MAG: glycosyltransferase, partial [Candidatus Omnitrophota bacterium]